MNRRSILSALCTGALALLAPVVAWAKPRRTVRFRNYGVEPMVLAPDGRWYRASVKHKAEMDLLTKLARGGWEYEHSEALKFRAEADSLRALLAEARERLREDHYLMAYDDGEPAQMGDAFRIDHGVLIARIDDALKGHEHA